MTATVRDNPAADRFEIYEDGQRVGLAVYRLNGDRIAFTHTEVDPAFGGRGLARQLVTTALDDARRRGLAVLPFCPYVRKVIAENTDSYLDLVPEGERARFGLAPSAG
ncbi:GNAT family N-acetyltransferase [Actinoallomurus rhizosphaericola]|uniref:GNAT family N-acetyltransferase n=1 Tax=Actinoallomurus rhizosphaericola TaxID=2952536 RepID=UPI0020906484|nr:GNAT family N-acetyltransferase [Actinoallomurus rhizosphaericola]MCO5994294.1 N-acetyltransferase [Actinoallomurus rhizosphaericola]